MIGRVRETMDQGHRQWVARLLAAAERAADQLRLSGDPVHRPLIEDIDELRERLRGELEVLEGDT